MDKKKSKTLQMKGPRDGQITKMYIHQITEEHCALA